MGPSNGLKVPILQQGSRLIVSVQDELSDTAWSQLSDELLDRVGKTRSIGVVLDVSGLDVVDSFASRTIAGLGQMVGYRGAQMVVTGIGPAVAFSMVQLGVSFEGIPTTLDLDDALAVLDRPR